MNQKGLVGEVSTRWGSKYRMLERMYYNREPVQAILMSGELLLYTSVNKFIN